MDERAGEIFTVASFHISINACYKTFIYPSFLNPIMSALVLLSTQAFTLLLSQDRRHSKHASISKSNNQQPFKPLLPVHPSSFNHSSPSPPIVSSCPLFPLNRLIVFRYLPCTPCNVTIFPRSSHSRSSRCFRCRPRVAPWVGWFVSLPR